MKKEEELKRSLEEKNSQIYIRRSRVSVTEELTSYQRKCLSIVKQVSKSEKKDRKISIHYFSKQRQREFVHPFYIHMCMHVLLKPFMVSRNCCT